MDSVTTRPGASAHLWTRFWTEAGRHGCTQSFPAASQAGIARGWAQLLSRSRGGSMLDVACGRGAVMDHAAGAGLAQLVGVDIAVFASSDHGGRDIRGGIDALDLPFADHAFDIVTSQFGIEYAGLAPAALEAARVSRARLAFLVHAGNGVVVRQAREQADHARWIDRDLNAFDILGDHAAAGATPDATATITRLVDTVLARAREAENVALLSGFAQIARGFIRAPSQRDVEALAHDWREHGARLADLSRAAPDAQEVAQTARCLSDAGFTAAVRDEISDRGDLVGHWITAERTKGI